MVLRSLYTGHRARVATLLATEWSLQGYQVEILLLDGAERHYGVPPTVAVHEAPTHRFGLPAPFRGLQEAFWLHTALRGRPDAIILCFDTHASLGLLAAGYGDQLIVCDRDALITSPGWLAERLQTLLYPRTRAIVCPSALGALLSRVICKHTRVAHIPDPVLAWSEAKPLLSRPPVILNTAPFERQSLHAVLIDVFNELNPPDWQLLLHGHGPLAVPLRYRMEGHAQAARMRIEANHTHREDIFAEAQIYVYLNRRDTFPQPLLEAMASGLAVVAYEGLYGASDLIEHNENGLLVPPGDPILLRDTLRALIQDPGRRQRLGRAAQAVRHTHSLATISQRYLQFVHPHHAHETARQHRHLV